VEDAVIDTSNFVLNLNPGTTASGLLFVTIKWDGTRLSFTGVEGPQRSGNCVGSVGQCFRALDDVVSFADGWDAVRARVLRGLWDRWHLNDMRPGCIHQRRWDTTTKVTLYTYRLNSATQKARRDLEQEVRVAVKRGETFMPKAAQARLMNAPYEIVTDGDAEHCIDPIWYELHKTEDKAAGWVRPTEHPDGLLCKPCPTCGYEYGSQWLHEAVPPQVIAYLASLPVTTTPNPWGTA
jgi:hypothetical protein